MPLHPQKYANLLRGYLKKHNTSCWLLNTGWTGGEYGVGKRIPLSQTRLMLKAILSGELTKAQFKQDQFFNINVPTEINGVETVLLTPQETWTDKKAYTVTAQKLLKMFEDNYKIFDLEKNL